MSGWRRSSAAANAAVHGSETSDRSASSRCAAPTFLRTAWPLKRWTRPSRCSKSAGLAGRFQWTREWHHQWKSIPSCPIDVEARTIGQNGELNAAWTSDMRSTDFSSVLTVPLADP